MDKKRKHKIFVFIIFLIFPLFAQAEEVLTLSLTPPIFQITLSPGEVWASSLKLVNVNPYDLTLRVKAMDFKAKDEEGGSIFIPESSSGHLNYSLAQWIEVSRDPIFVPREKSIELPFTIRIPETAEPGGHYAAILVGAEPAMVSHSGANVLVSSYVSSLILLKIAGEVRESGVIREFSTSRRWYDQPNILLTLRFQNTGNVHLQPRGEIIISDARGAERKRIPIHYGNDYGNVLPESVRKFSFEWKGDGGIREIGKYKAEAVFGFGNEEKKFITHAIYFWIIPVVPILGILGGTIFVVFGGAFLIRSYVRRTIVRYQKETVPLRRGLLSGRNLLGDMKRLEAMLVDRE